MAITISKYPQGIYPAYNDSFIEFSSSLTGNNKAEITIYPSETFTRIFVIYPDSNGKYLFNLKDAIKAIFNQNGFEDSNFDTSVYYKSITGLYLLQSITIKVLSDESEEQTFKNYEFFKAAKQISESIYSNPYQLLSFSKNGIDHSLTYFEGFPFHFDLQRVEAASRIIVKNTNTGNESSAIYPTLLDAFRINIDKGAGNNWTSDGFLPLIVGQNKLEIYSDGVFKSNVIVDKRKVCSGVYLKWFNRNGGFSHYLFDKYFTTQTKSTEDGLVQNDEFKNISEATGMFKSTGKRASEILSVKANYEQRDYEILKDILTSPLVQMYTSKTAYIEGRFVDVFVDGSLSHSNKKGKNEISLTVELSELVTAKL